MLKLLRTLFVLFALFLCQFALGANTVGDPQIKTDDPYYPGELSCSTLSRLINTALNTSGRPSTGDATKDQILKLWYWRLEHYFHIQSPEEYLVPGITPNPSAGSDNSLLISYDCLSQQFSYGHGVCGTNHAMLRPIFEAAGFQSRRRSIVGDTTHEVFYSNRWGMVNTDSASIISMSNSASAEFAGVDDIIGNINLLLNYPLAIPQYPYGSQVSGAQGTHSQDWYGYYNGGFNLTTSQATHMYGEGFQARPVMYVLMRGEKFTRFNGRDGLPNYLSDAGGYRYWGFYGAGGPYRDWSYVGEGFAPALQPPPTSSAIANTRFGNGIFEWSPNLTAGDFLDGTVAKDSNITYGTTSPHLTTTGGSGKVTLSFFSPYVIVAKPSDGIAPSTAGATGGAWIIPNCVGGSVPVEISVNNGASWTSAGSLSGTSKLDFTDLVKGRYSYLVRLTLSNNTTGLDAFSLNTCVEVATAVFPMLKANGSTVTYNAGSMGVVEVIPDYSSLTTANAFKVSDSGNLNFNAESSTNSQAYTTSNNQPAYVVYSVSAPSGAILKKIDAAANCGVRVPPPGGQYMQLWVSTDSGATYTKFGEYDAPADNELSSGWVYGSADVSAANVSQAYVKVAFYNGGYTASLNKARFYGEYATGAPNAMSITHNWNDSGGNGKTFTQNITAGTTSTTYSVPTLNTPVSNSVVFSVAASPTPPVLTTITVSPTPVSVAAGGTQTFTAKAYDQFGVLMSSQPTFTWSVSGGGSINSSGLFTAGTVAGGPYTVTASAGGKSGTASVTVTATSTLGSITVSPASVTLSTGGTQSFSAKAYDQYGNLMSLQPAFTWSATSGTVNTSGLYTAGGTTGSFKVTATSGAKSGTANITIQNPPVLTSIVVTPATATLAVGGTLQFSAVANDQYNNPLSPQPAIIWSANAGLISTAGLLTAPASPGSVTVSAKSGAVTGTANVTVTLTPTITSPPSVNGPVTINVPVNFSSNASDPAGGTVTYTWNFGDGTSATGPNVTHTYSSAGNFTLTLTVTSSTSGGSSTMTLAITVVDPNVGGGGGGATASSLTAMTFSKLSGNMMFTLPNKDSLSFSGVVPGLPAGFDPNGVQLTLIAGTASIQFTLDRKGRAHNASGSVMLTIKGKRDPKTKKVVFAGGDVPVKGKLAHGTWSKAWGFDPNGTVPSTIALEIDLNSARYGATVSIFATEDTKHAKFKH